MKYRRSEGFHAEAKVLFLVTAQTCGSYEYNIIYYNKLGNTHHD